MANPSGQRYRIITDADIPTPPAGKVWSYWDATGPRYKDDVGVAHSYPSVASFIGRTGAIVAVVGDYSAFYDPLGAAATSTAFSIQRSNHTGTQLAATISDFNEAAQDAIGTSVIDTSTIDFTYDDIGNQLSAIVINDSIVNGKLANMATATFKGRTTAGTGDPEDLTATQATALLDVATPVLKGLMSATDKSSLDSFVAAQLYYNVKDYGATGNGSTDDLASINAAITAIPSGATLYFPRGTYKITGTITVPVAKSVRFLGGGKDKSVITTNHATLDMVVVLDWNTDFTDIGFATSVTRTGGYAVNGGSYNGGSWIVGLNFIRCSFAGMFNGILSNGTLCWFKDLSFTNTVNFSVEFGGLGPAGFQAPTTGLDGPNVNSLIHNCTFDCLPASVAHIEVKQCGSLIISDCDIIRATNNLRLNPSTTLKGVFSVYSCNTFFDTAGGSSVKFMGVGNIQRAKFTNCWFSGGVNGCEFASTATTLPTGIDFVNCDIFNNSANGILANGVQDFSITNARIAANATAGVNVSASASSATKFNIQNATIGPTAGYAGNGTGVLINAGTYGSYVISGCALGGNTTNVNDGGTIANVNNKIIDGNLGHLLNYGPFATKGTNTAIANTETRVVGATAPANSMRVGTTFRFTASGLWNNTAAGTVSTIRFRIGTTTLTGNIPAGITVNCGATARANIPFTVDGMVSIVTAGAGGTALGFMSIGLPNAIAPIVAAVTTAAVAVDTTAAKEVELTYISGLAGNTVNFQNATIQVVQS